MSKPARVREDGGPERVPMHEQQRDVMTAPQRKGFKRRWVNDVEGGTRVAAMMRAGWRTVTDDVKVGEDQVLNQNQALGSGARKYVGGDIWAVLMEIEQELYDADQAAKADRAKERERAIFRGEGVDGIDGRTDVEDRVGFARSGRR